MCGAEHARFGFKDALSENFWTLSQTSRLFPHRDPDAPVALCGACVWCETLALRCVSWVATERGIWWIPRSGLLAILLDPPAPPFAIACPLYGIAHGGESNGHRAIWCGVSHADPLVKLQSKHTAIYAEVATSRDHYPLQIDDSTPVLIDRPLWSRLASELLAITTSLRDAGVGANDVRDGLRHCALRREPALRARIAGPRSCGPIETSHERSGGAYSLICSDAAAAAEAREETSNEAHADRNKDHACHDCETCLCPRTSCANARSLDHEHQETLPLEANCRRDSAAHSLLAYALRAPVAV